MLEEQIDIEKHFKTLQNRKMGGGVSSSSRRGVFTPLLGGGGRISLGLGYLDRDPLSLSFTVSLK